MTPPMSSPGTDNDLETANPASASKPKQQKTIDEATTTMKTSPPSLDKIESCGRRGRQLEDVANGHLPAPNDSAATRRHTKRDRINDDNDGRSSLTPPKKPRLSPLRPRSPPPPPPPAGGGQSSNHQQGGPEVIDMTFTSSDDDDDKEKKDNRGAAAAEGGIATVTATVPPSSSETVAGRSNVALSPTAAVQQQQRDFRVLPGDRRCHRERVATAATIAATAASAKAAGPLLPKAAVAASTTATTTTTAEKKKEGKIKIHRFLVEIPPRVQKGQRLQVVHPATGRTMGVTLPLLRGGREMLVKDGKCYMVVVAPEAFPPPPTSRGRGRPGDGGRTSPPSVTTRTKEGTRRSGRRRRQTEVLPVGHDTLNDYGKARIRVGRKYQAAVPEWGLEEKMAVKDSEEESKVREEDDRYEQIWNPVKYGLVKDDPMVTDFLVKTVPCHLRDLGYLALHRAGYDPTLAPSIFRDLTKSSSSFDINDRRGSRLTSLEMNLFQEYILQVDDNNDDDDVVTVKNFRTISHKIGRSINSCLLHYYSTFKSTQHYRDIRTKLPQSYSDCEVCEDGGYLLVCDSCHKCWHLQCLDPPLVEVPEGDWYCSDCERKQKQRRRSSKEGCWTTVTTASSPVSHGAGATTHGGSSPSSSSFPVIDLTSKYILHQQNAGHVTVGHGGGASASRREGGSSSSKAPSVATNNSGRDGGEDGEASTGEGRYPYSKPPIFV